MPRYKARYVSPFGRYTNGVLNFHRDLFLANNKELARLELVISSTKLRRASYAQCNDEVYTGVKAKN